MSESQTQQDPQHGEHPATGTWLKLDARDPEAEAAEAAYLKESSRVRRGVWIGNFVMGLFVAAVLTGTGYVLIPKLGAPAAATAAEFIGSAEQRAQAASLVTTLNGQVTLWKLQHNGRAPDFAQYSQWEQFAKPTDTFGVPLDGGARSGGPICGPYTQGRPANPINNLSSIWATDEPIGPGSTVSGGRAVGFVFHIPTLTFWVTDVAGNRVIDPAAAPEAVAGVSLAEAQKQQEAVATGTTRSVEAFKAALARYRSQHHNNLPDFNDFPGWDQLIKKTDARGLVTEKGEFGPYLERPLQNPHTGTARVQVVDKSPTLRFKALSSSVGYVLDSTSGKVWAVDAQGELVRE